MERGQAARVAMGRSGYKSPRPAFLKYFQNFKLMEPFLGAAPYKGSIIGVTPGRRDESQTLGIAIGLSCLFIRG